MASQSLLCCHVVSWRRAHQLRILSRHRYVELQNLKKQFFQIKKFLLISNTVKKHTVESDFSLKR
jgi:hypothetical protein